MVVGTLEIELRLDGCFNLKEKRRVLRGLIERIRNQHALAVSEVGDHDLWNRSVIGVAAVAAQAELLGSALNHVMAQIDRCDEVEIVSVDRVVQRT